ncbi:hypothetical protein GCM10010294_17240 [Streptomyces griseoloalbus]|uniref:thioesterase domain-containing protein n=1 Tax=Streptomyces griseoloalbus TaxID=67303 RepID=UPI0019BC0108|nr:hypothetical protein GCM10010294_17240 [Streptomyces griseoloalbus]
MGSEWLRTCAPAGTVPAGTGPPVRLVRFPHAGGAASAFVSFARLLTPACAVLGVQYPGRLNDHLDAVGRTVTAALAAPARQPTYAGFPAAGSVSRAETSVAPGGASTGPGGPWR